jgi:hypothetical protein
MGLSSQIPIEAFQVEADLSSMAPQVRVVQRVLVFEEAIMHLPELSLRVSSFRRLGRHGRVGVRREQWEVTEDET